MYKICPPKKGGGGRPTYGYFNFRSKFRQRWRLRRKPSILLVGEKINSVAPQFFLIVPPVPHHRPGLVPACMYSHREPFITDWKGEIYEVLLYMVCFIPGATLIFEIELVGMYWRKLTIQTHPSSPTKATGRVNTCKEQTHCHSCQWRQYTLWNE